jgi:hypothetical protein
MIRRQFETTKRSELVFEGRNLIGCVSRKGGAFLAIDRNGARLGTFPARAEAFAVVLKSKRAHDIGCAP